MPKMRYNLRNIPNAEATKLDGQGKFLNATIEWE